MTYSSNIKVGHFRQTKIVRKILKYYKIRSLLEFLLNFRDKYKIRMLVYKCLNFKNS